MTAHRRKKKVSALLTEKANAGLIVPRLSNTLIRAAKTVDAAIVRVEILEHWQRLKVHGMSLDRCLGEGKMELLKREVESSTGIQLKALPRWLINENPLKCCGMHAPRRCCATATGGIIAT